MRAPRVRLSLKEALEDILDYRVYSRLQALPPAYREQLLIILWSNWLEAPWEETTREALLKTLKLFNFVPERIRSAMMKTCIDPPKGTEATITVLYYNLKACNRLCITCGAWMKCEGEDSVTCTACQPLCPLCELPAHLGPDEFWCHRCSMGEVGPYRSMEQMDI